MQISALNRFAAEPAAVLAMLTTKEYLERVCAATEALSYSVAVDGPHTTTTRELPTPDVAQRFVHGNLVVVEDVVWGEAAADGSRQGTLVLTSPGMPVRMDGTATMAPEGEGTTIAYDADLRINIPFLGGKLEAQAAPVVLSAIGAQAQVGDDWLAARH